MSVGGGRGRRQPDEGAPAATGIARASRTGGREARGARTPRNGAAAVVVALVAPRPRTRSLVRAAFPRRRARVVVTRTADELVGLLRSELVDGVVVDVGSGGPDGWRAAERARDFPALPFFAALPLRATDGPAIARCAALELADVLVEGADDDVVRGLVMPSLFSTRFAAALAAPPPALRLESPLQRDAWRAIVARGGRPVQTAELAAELGVTREHLSRRFSEGGAPTLKRTIDLVRVLAAAELLKNPGHDVGAVAAVLGFASSSHLSTTARRVAGVRPSSLARLRGVDLVGRFLG